MPEMLRLKAFDCAIQGDYTPFAWFSEATGTVKERVKEMRRRSSRVVDYRLPAWNDHVARTTAVHLT